MTDIELFSEIQSYLDAIQSGIDSFSARLGPKLVLVTQSPLSLDIAFEPEKWMVNSSGIVHGGITASYVDMAMGTLAKYLRGGVMSPTVDMQVSYHRPVAAAVPVVARAKCISSGRTISSFSAEIFSSGEPDKILVSATGLYLTKAEKK
jgi:uncharacterized protein (TIGR00369 family)